MTQAFHLLLTSLRDKFIAQRMVYLLTGQKRKNLHSHSSF